MTTILTEQDCTDLADALLSTNALTMLVMRWCQLHGFNLVPVNGSTPVHPDAWTPAPPIDGPRLGYKNPNDR